MAACVDGIRNLVRAVTADCVSFLHAVVVCVPGTYPWAVICVRLAAEEVRIRCIKTQDYTEYCGHWLSITFSHRVGRCIH